MLLLLIFMSILNIYFIFISNLSCSSVMEKLRKSSMTMRFVCIFLTVNSILLLTLNHYKSTLWSWCYSCLIKITLIGLWLFKLTSLEIYFLLILLLLTAYIHHNSSLSAWSLRWGNIILLLIVLFIRNILILLLLNCTI